MSVTTRIRLFSTSCYGFRIISHASLFWLLKSDGAQKCSKSWINLNAYGGQKYNQSCIEIILTIYNYLFFQVPPGGGLHRHYPGCEVSEGEGFTGADRRQCGASWRTEHGAHGERHGAFISEGKHHQHDGVSERRQEVIHTEASIGLVYRWFFKKVN